MLQQQTVSYFPPPTPCILFSVYLCTRKTWDSPKKKSLPLRTGSMIYVSLHKFGSTTWKFFYRARIEFFFLWMLLLCMCVCMCLCVFLFLPFRLCHTQSRESFFFKCSWKPVTWDMKERLRFLSRGRRKAQHVNSIWEIWLFLPSLSLERNHGRVYLNVIFRSQLFRSHHHYSHCHPLLHSFLWV